MTAGIHIVVGVEAGAIGFLYAYAIPVVYHSVSGSRRQIFRTANVTAALYGAMLALEASGVLSHRPVFGFAAAPSASSPRRHGIRFWVRLPATPTS